MVTSDTAHPDVIVGELTLLNGQRQLETAHMALLTPPRRARADRRSETVMVFLDLGGGGAAGLARAMLEHFNRTYWRCRGPVTSAVRQAIDAANAHLREENRLMPISHRRRAGLVCAVLREDCVYLAQIGPAKALLVHGGRVSQFPTGPQDVLPLGVSSGLDIQYSHSRLCAGDRLLLTGESWTVQLPGEALTDTLGAEETKLEEVMLELERQAGTDPFSALVVECPPLPEVPAPIPSEDRLAAPSAEVQQPRKPAKQEPLMPAPKRRTPSQSVFKPKPAVGMSQMQASSTVSKRVQQGEIKERLDQSREGLLRVGLALGDGAREALMRVLPEPEEAPPRPRRRRRRAKTDNVAMMVGIAVGIPLLVAFLVVTFYLQRGDTERREALVNRVRKAAEAARQAGAEDARARWDEVLWAAEEALVVVPEDQEILSLRDQARARLDEVDGAVRPELIPLWNYGAGQGRKVAVSRMHVYVLDAAQAQVTQHALDQSRRGFISDQYIRVAYTGQQVGGEEIGGVRDIMWLRAGGTWTDDALIILTEGDKLFQHSPSWGLGWVPFDSEGAPDDLRVLRPYDGKLYILDPRQSQIWRFRYTEDGFGEPEGYFAGAVPPLDGAVDMTIDGAVYVLLADGRIHKFFGGEEQPYQVSGVPQPLGHPVALVAEGDSVSGALYVANADTESIVALTKSGEFIHQIKGDGAALSGLEALAIEENSRTLYVMANGRLYAVALPALPAPSGAGE